MKKSTRVKMVGNLIKLGFCAFIGGAYCLLLDFIFRCNIESDSYFFAMCGIMFIFTVLIGYVVYDLFISDTLDEVDRMYKLHKRHENKEFIERKKRIAELQYNERLNKMHKKFTDFEKSLNEEENK